MHTAYFQTYRFCSNIPLVPTSSHSCTCKHKRLSSETYFPKTFRYIFRWIHWNERKIYSLKFWPQKSKVTPLIVKMTIYKIAYRPQLTLAWVYPCCLKLMPQCLDLCSQQIRDNQGDLCLHCLHRQRWGTRYLRWRNQSDKNHIKIHSWWNQNVISLFTDKGILKAASMLMLRLCKYMHFKHSFG